MYLSFCIAARSQLYIQLGAGFKTTGDVQITLDSINVANDDESADFSGSIILFKGGGNVSLGGTGLWVIKSLVLDKGTNQVALLVPIQVNSQVQFIGGKLNLNNQVLTLSPGAILQGENDTRRIIGSNGGIVQTTVSLNAPASQNPGNIGVQITSSQNLGSVAIKRWHQADGYSPGKVLRFYEIIPTNNKALDATLRLYYLDAELNNNAEASLDIFARSSSQDPWSLFGNTTKEARTNYVEKTNVNAFQQYSLGSNSQAALPLTWGAVSASCQKGKIEVRWNTFQESGIYNFIVQRSTDGSMWTDLASLPASRNSTTTNNYSYTDAAAPAGVVLYYRIAAVENETNSYSHVASTTGCKKTARMQLAPVPVATITTLSIYAEKTYQGAIKLCGADGRVYQQRQVTIAAGYCQFQFDVSRLPAGTYYLQVDQPDGSAETISFIKQ